MRTLIRIAAGITLVGALAIVNPPPVSASHGTGTTGNSPIGGTHEPMPTPAVAVPGGVVCAVAGSVLPGTPGGGTQHLVPPVGNDATHSHFSFIDAAIACSDTGLIPVAADGGNDGHIVDIDGQSVPHAFNDHHGSTNESGWSTSSDYSGGSGGGQSNACAGSANTNKADIVAGTSSGWVKYVRVGTVLYVWGCFTSGPIASSGTPAFSATLAIASPSTQGVSNLPFCLVPNNDVTGTSPSCGFSIAGVASRGPSFV
jgi:hypothetical protein